MSNPYFTFSPRFIPGMKVRATAVNTQFDKLEDAFDFLPASAGSLPLGKATTGIESGSGNAYVVAMPNTRVANADGDEVVFKATHQNSGASTLQVDAIASVPLVRWNGDALSSGDVLVNSYYTTRYDSTGMRFLIVAPAQSTIAGTLTYAVPTGKAKLAASAGTVSTLIRSDADIAIDQTIAPTWSGQHTFSQPILAPTGSLLSPAYSFSGDPDTGISQASGADSLSFETGGVQRVSIANGLVLMQVAVAFDAGTAPNPSLRFSADPNTGTYSVGADDWGVSTGGVLRFDISTTAVTSTLPLLGPAGAIGTPTYSFSGDPNTGAYSVGADDWGVATNGILRFDVSTTAVTSTLRFLGPAGLVGTPTYSFSGDPNTGAYSVGADDWGVATNGVLRFDISTTAITSTLQFLSANGSAAAPLYSFSVDPNTGVYRVGADLVGFSAGGAVPLYVGNSFVVCDGQIQSGTGSVSAPSISFGGGSNNTGFYLGAANQIRATAGGADIAAFYATGIQALLGQVLALDGSAGAPGFGFANDLNTGLYRVGTDQFALVGAGTAVFACDATQNPIINGNVSTLSPTGGAAAALPANPVGYLAVIVNGTQRRFAYYNN